jgi:hypothetical protein
MATRVNAKKALHVLTGALLTVMLFSACRAEAASPCRLLGRVRFVTHGADYRIRYVSAHEDLRVRFVYFTPNRPGQWKQVDSGEDFTVRVVHSHEDFTVRVVKVGEGC